MAHFNRLIIKLLLSLKFFSLRQELREVDRKIFQNAFNIALRTLRHRYTSEGIHAGKTHFSDVWLRDSCFASFGSLNIGDYKIVRTNLTTIMDNMKEDGQVPLRIGQKLFFLKYLGFKGKDGARYIDDKGMSKPADGNSLFIITAAKYLEKSKDLDFFKNNFKKLKKAVDWNFLLDEDDDHLIEEGPYGGWADSLKKQGKVLYTNVLHYKAVDSFAHICGALKKRKEQMKYIILKDQIKHAINSNFWNGSYYIDWIHRHRHTYFSTDGNILAIIFDLATKHQAEKIQNCIREFDLDHGFITQTNYPKYKDDHIFFPFFAMQMADYHNGLEWLWLGCIDAVAKYKIQEYEKASSLLLRIAKKILEYKGVYEVYHDGKPVHRMLYRSEKGFAWSAGLFVWACKELSVVD